MRRLRKQTGAPTPERVSEKLWEPPPPQNSRTLPMAGLQRPPLKFEEFSRVSGRGLQLAGCPTHLTWDVLHVLFSCCFLVSLLFCL